MTPLGTNQISPKCCWHSHPKQTRKVFCLDVLGLQDPAVGDKEEVYHEFREQLQQRPEGWYQTGLQKVINHPALPPFENKLWVVLVQVQEQDTLQFHRINDLETRQVETFHLTRALFSLAPNLLLLVGVIKLHLETCVAKFPDIVSEKQRKAVRRQPCQWGTYSMRSSRN